MYESHKFPSNIHHLPSSSNIFMLIKDQNNENKRKRKEILCMYLYDHKVDLQFNHCFLFPNQAYVLFICFCFVPFKPGLAFVNSNLFSRWWYWSCPKCNKKLGGIEKEPIYKDRDAIIDLSVPWLANSFKPFNLCFHFT